MICPHCGNQIYAEKLPAFSRSRNRIIEEIKKAVCDVFDVPVSKIYLKLRKRELVEVRQVIGYFISKHKLGSLADIATCFGPALSNHTSIIHGNQTVIDLIITDENFKSKIEYLDKIVNDIVKFKPLVAA